MAVMLQFRLREDCMRVRLLFDPAEVRGVERKNAMAIECIGRDLEESHDKNPLGILPMDSSSVDCSRLKMLRGTGKNGDVC